MKTTTNYHKLMKLFSDPDEAWTFLRDLDRGEYEICDYGILDNMPDTPYYVLYRTKD